MCLVSVLLKYEASYRIGCISGDATAEEKSVCERERELVISVERQRVRLIYFLCLYIGQLDASVG
jgi:hypothetical protein